MRHIVGEDAPTYVNRQVNGATLAAQRQPRRYTGSNAPHTNRRLLTDHTLLRASSLHHPIYPPTQGKTCNCLYSQASYTVEPKARMASR